MYIDWFIIKNLVVLSINTLIIMYAIHGNINISPTKLSEYIPVKIHEKIDNTINLG